MSDAHEAAQIAFRNGQVDALARTLLASPALYTPEMRHSLALRWLSRAWSQYREDRAITLGPVLAGAECAGDRNAFLALLERALPPADNPLRAAIRTVRTIAIRPLAQEAAATEAIVATSADILDAVITALETAKLPADPLERLRALIERFRYSTGDAVDALSATAQTPCWALNLVATARGHAFALSDTPLPFPGLVQRRLFRADRDLHQRRDETRDCLNAALYQTACDIAVLPRAADVFAQEFARLRSNSRLVQTWFLLFALGQLSPAQLARALPATKAGAGKLLRQLETGRLARSAGPLAPFVCAYHAPVALPDWRDGLDSGVVA